jgi:B12-binding domain/radical SAM domain protein
LIFGYIRYIYSDAISDVNFAISIFYILIGRIAFRIRYTYAITSKDVKYIVVKIYKYFLSLIFSDNMDEIAFICYYTDRNKNSFNALVGSLEESDYSKYLSFYFLRNERELFSKIQKIKDNHKRVILAFSFFSFQKKRISDVIKNLQAAYANSIEDGSLILIAGGSHPTGDPFGTLEIGFNFVFVGEGEESIREFVSSLINGSNFKKVKGIVFKDGDEIVFTGRRKNIDLNLYPPFSVKSMKFGPIEITRGCPFTCFYCQTPQIFGNRVRHRDIDQIVKYAKIMRQNRLRDIRFVSPNAFSYGSRDGKELNLEILEAFVSDLHKAISPGGRLFIGSFPSEVRPEHVTEETIKIVKKYASNTNIILGAQSGSNRILKLINRSHTIEDVYNAVDTIVRFDLKPHVDFIFGLPGETEEDINLTINAIKTLIEKGAIIHAHKFTPLPATAFMKSQPTPLNKEIKSFLGKLIREKKMYGSIN